MFRVFIKQQLRATFAEYRLHIPLFIETTFYILMTSVFYSSQAVRVFYNRQKYGKSLYLDDILPFSFYKQCFSFAFPDTVLYLKVVLFTLSATPTFTSKL